MRESTSHSLASFVKRHPSTLPHLASICRRFARRGDLTGSMKLGERLDREQEYLPLMTLFGPEALSLSGRGAVRLSFDRFFVSSPDERKREWIWLLHQALDLPMVNRKKALVRAKREAAVLAEQWRLAFPELESLHEHLQTLIKSNSMHIKIADAGIEPVRLLWFNAGKTINFLLANRQPMSLSDLGARLFGDSKVLRSGELISLVKQWLAIEINPGKDGNSASPLELQGIFDNPSAVKATLFGPVVYYKDGRKFDFIKNLWHLGETATLSWDNLKGVDSMVIEGTDTVVTCENESPFYRLVRERFPHVVIYTQGFPNASVTALYRLLSRRPEVRYRRHWGDTDLAGLRIAECLHRHCPVELWRCGLPDVNRLRKNLCPLPGREKEKIESFLNSHPDFPFRIELAFTLKNGWLEQESWE